LIGAFPSVGLIIQIFGKGGKIMQNIINGLVGLAVLGFLLAVVTILLGPMIMGIHAETFSRACTNLSLIAIALSICCPKKSSG